MYANYNPWKIWIHNYFVLIHISYHKEIMTVSNFSLSLPKEKEIIRSTKWIDFHLQPSNKTHKQLPAGMKDTFGMSTL